MPTPLKLGSYDPHDKQREFLGHASTRVPGVLVVHAVAGRGGGKTIAGILWMLAACLDYNKGCQHLWTAPTYRMLADIFIPAWRAIVPSWLYTLNLSEMRIDFINGSVIRLRSREHPDRLRGPSYAGVFHDEIAMDRSRYAWDVVMANIRQQPGPQAGQLFCATITTPRLGWHQLMVQGSDAPVTKWTSLDNPWASKVSIEQMKAQFGPAMYAQEVLADWVAQAGRIWPAFSDELYPAGNIWPRGHNRKDGYILACDLGTNSSWLIVQTQGDVDVVTAEYTPGNRAGPAHVLQRINAEYGAPFKVIVGSDVDSRWVGDTSKTPRVFFRQMWGEGVPVTSPTGSSTDKEIQRHVLEGRIFNTDGDRRLCVSKDLVSHDAEQQQDKRGILEVMRQDQWPDDPRSSEGMPKDGWLEHTRDAALYYCIKQHAPIHVRQPVHPA